MLYFQWPDYVMFAFMLAISALIGIYFGCFGSRQKSVAEYLLGGRNMNILPVATSLIASHISAVTLLGVPSEIYTYGTQYWMVCLSSIFVGVIVCWIYMPVFYKLQVNSIFEYLENRFNSSVRLMASVLFFISLILYVPIVVYLPALAFSQVSGVSIHAITPLVSCVCIFYTMLGGLKAVVWTDFVQQITLMGASIIVIVLGLIKVGGFTNMWNINLEGDRIEFFNMDPSPFSRLTFLTTVVGTTFTWLASCGTNQSMVQRFLAVPSLSAARWTMIIFTIGMIICKSLSCFTGLLIHAYYHDCDPTSVKAITRQDQLLPYYVMDIAGNYPGLPGLFVAGVFSAALSTMSTCLNTLSGTIFEDFLSLCLPCRIREKYASLIMKITVLVLGILCVAMAFVVEKLGSVIQMTVSLGSITYGAQLGLFTLGMLFPMANSKGAFVGSLASLAVMGTMVIGEQTAVAAGQLTYPKKPMSVEGCSLMGVNTTQMFSQGVNSTVVPTQEPFILFRISFMYLNMIGCFIVLIVGVVVSYITGAKDLRDVDRDLISPVLHRWLPERSKPQEFDKATVQPLMLFKDIKH
ncbi:sodium-coupled monocarboxylate transporter 1 [Anabrus simplex]|uniref:sodium-coupled monocarboxylate transporter 1 n=1 Tax=Anabrus simplex TaxID=316456 RepID=UPI0035A27BA0